ncbi:hypothetical protein HYC85_023480 [Camellia sinensis]|uniref:SET domain-containing protein n=1 Tax=Camellia sinensis TaxID=4442 RepID=A0A7J7GH41_CAMSI|nr:hypothetical protein HYC85_023480 [Camellia sinensis]
MANGMVPSRGAKTWFPPEWPISDGNVSKETNLKAKYFRRRVRAIREFPPFCGINAICPTEEEHLRIAFGNKTSIAPVEATMQGSLSRETVRAKEECSLVRKTARTGIEELDRHVRDRNAKKRDMKKKLLPSGNASYENKGGQVVKDKGDFSICEQDEDSPVVERYTRDVGPHGKLVFKFELKRISGQPELAWKEVKKSKRFKIWKGLCVADISRGKELFPICAVNTIDNKRPPKFNYITEMKYPDWYCPTTPKGCDCIGGCLDSKKCSCMFNNGGKIPYNCNGAIVESKPLPIVQLSSSEVVEDERFTVDAKQCGNVGRFINHSCSPNLYAQNVLYDHEDKSKPHIMLFAAENIPPLKELTYHYNYLVDQVRDSNGNIKMKSCYCGAVECTGRMY